MKIIKIYIDDGPFLGRVLLLNPRIQDINIQEIIATAYDKYKKMNNTYLSFQEYLTESFPYEFGSVTPDEETYIYLKG